MEEGDRPERRKASDTGVGKRPYIRHHLPEEMQEAVNVLRRAVGRSRTRLKELSRGGEYEGSGDILNVAQRHSNALMAIYYICATYGMESPEKESMSD